MAVWLLCLVALGAAWDASFALAGAPAARYGSDGVALHAGPALPTGGGPYDAAAVGLSRGERGTGFFSAVKVAANGTLNRRFGVDGFARTASPGASGAPYLRGDVEAVAVQPDGKILLVGYRGVGRSEARRSPILERLLPSGVPDPSFGQDGVVIPRHLSGLGEWYSGVAVERNGSIVVSGSVTQAEGYHPRGARRPTALVRAFRPDGRLDRSFGHDGTIGVSDPPSGFYYTAMTSIQVLPGGGLLASGYSRYRLLLEKLTADGRRARDFGHAGLVTFGEANAGCVSVCEWTSSFFLQGRKIVALASLDELTETTGAVVRFLADGRVDRSFGHHGLVRTRGAEQLQESEAIAPTVHGRFVVGGYGYESGPRGEAGLTVAGFTAAGARDRGFARHGWFDLERGSTGNAYAALHDRGTAIVAGGVSFHRHGGPGETPYLLAFARLPR